MSENKNKNTASTIGIITTVAGVVTGLIPVVSNAVEKARGNKEEKIMIPPLYDKNFPIELNQVVELLNDYGFKVIPTKLQIKDASVKYKDCFDFQVIDSNPKHKTKVKPGATVYVKYITQDVIDESNRMFNDIQSDKLQKKETSKEKKANIINNAKNNVKKIFVHEDKSE